jgi:peptidoglycan-associated lipoprotein
MVVMKSWYPLLLLAVASAACHTRPPALASSRSITNPPAAPARPPAPVTRPVAATTARSTAAPLSEAELFRRMSLSDLNAEHPLGDAFFDYDQATLRDDTRRALQQDAQWLKKWPETSVRIDGHCDERGTAEYNLALGERRAVAVRAYLADLGVRPDRIQTRGLGKEAPFCQQDSESCWSQNRRGHFEIIGK